MEYDDAVLSIEMQLENPDKLNLDELAEPFYVVASTPDGYSGKIWEYGEKLMDLVQKKGGSRTEAFERIGWNTFYSAIYSSIVQKKIVQALSYAKYNFVHPEKSAKAILSHTRVITAIQAGLKTQKHPFINPSDLGVLDQSGQDVFAELLTIVDSLQVDDELRLQWSASALRFCPPVSNPYLIASEILEKTLLRTERWFSAYFLFRALSEYRDELWRSQFPLDIIKALIQNHLSDKSKGLDILVEICSDSDIQSKSRENNNLRLLIGILSLYLWSEHNFVDIEAMAWEFPTMLQVDYPNLSSTLSRFIVDKTLPDLPPQFIEEIEKLEKNLTNLINDAQNELRDRSYRGVPLAIKIYQDNLKNYFIPILDDIKLRKNYIKILDHITKIDPESLITDNEYQKSNYFPIEGNLLQKMINDSFEIKESLIKAGDGLEKIQTIQDERSMVSKDYFDLFPEFEIFADDLSETGRWAFAQLIPDLWVALNTGLDVYKREEDYYGPR